MLKAGIFLAFFFVAISHVSGDQETFSNEASQRNLAFALSGWPDSMSFMLPERSLMDKRGRQIFLPRPNSLMNALNRGKKSTKPSNDALKRYLAYGRPNSMIFMHPTRSLTEKRSKQIFLPRPNSLMNAIKGKRAFLHGSPNGFNFPIWNRSAMDVDESEDTEELEKRSRQIFLPRPNSLMNAIKGKRAFLHGSPNSFNFPIWTRSAMDVDESEDNEELESGDANLYESIEKYGKRGDGNFDVFLGNRG